MTKLVQKFSTQAFCTMIRLLPLALFLTLVGASPVLAQTKAYVTNFFGQYGVGDRYNHQHCSGHHTSWRESTRNRRYAERGFRLRGE